MQQTAIDRWLRKEFVYVSKVFTNTLPSHLPAKVRLEESGSESDGRYRYRFTAADDRQLSELTALLEMENITYTTRVFERGGMAGKLFNDPNKSFTLRVAWILFTLFIISIITSGLPIRLWNYLAAE
ncbi:MAG TPA: hypothetical protein PLA50_03515 [Bacteroidia bacterium]|nr:hypothetical protein [Bacteroidia bacterium]